jgi:hypothetical protein
MSRREAEWSKKGKKTGKGFEKDGVESQAVNLSGESLYIVNDYSE